MRRRILTTGAAAAALAVIMAGCAISIPVSSRKLDGPPHVRDFIDPMLKLKVLTWKQLVGQKLELTAEDSSGNPVPGAYVVMAYESGADSMKTDSLGVTYVPLTDELPERNPALYARKDGKEHRVTFRFFADIDTDEGEAPVKVDPYALDTLCGDRVMVLFPDAFADLAGPALAQLEVQRGHIEKGLGLVPVPWGLVLIDTAGSIVLTSTHYTRQGARYHLCPLTREEIPAGIYTASFRTFAKNCLMKAVPVSEVEALWFFNGLADYWADVYLDSLERAGELPEEAQLERAALDSVGRSRLDGVTEPVDLVKWRPDEQEDWNLGMELFRAYWHWLAAEENQEVIAAIVSDLVDLDKPLAGDLEQAVSSRAGVEALAELRHFRP